MSFGLLPSRAWHSRSFFQVLSQMNLGLASSTLSSCVLAVVCLRYVIPNDRQGVRLGLLGHERHPELVVFVDPAGPGVLGLQKWHFSEELLHDAMVLHAGDEIWVIEVLIRITQSGWIALAIAASCSLNGKLKSPGEAHNIISNSMS